MMISDFIHTMTFINIFLGARYFCILTYILSFALNTWGYSSGASGKKCASQCRRFFFFFKFYNIVLVLPNIEMNPPQVYLCSPSRTLLPPPSPPLPLGRPSAPAPSIQYCASNLDWRLISYMILYMFQCHSPKSPHPLPLPQSP